jgi:F-type H+-transporting ATPase subunit b
MILLADFNPILPEFGQFFWSSLLFLLTLLVLSRVAFKPIIQALNKRDQSIHDSLQMAEQARREMADLKSANDAEMARTREESARIIKEAKLAAEGIVNDAKQKAKDEAGRIVSGAQQEITNQKNAALAEVKNTAGKLAIDVATKVLQRELSGNAADQNAFVNGLIKDIKLN